MLSIHTLLCAPKFHFGPLIWGSYFFWCRCVVHFQILGFSCQKGIIFIWAWPILKVQNFNICLEVRKIWNAQLPSKVSILRLSLIDELLNQGWNVNQLMLGWWLSMKSFFNHSHMTKKYDKLCISPLIFLFRAWPTTKTWT